MHAIPQLRTAALAAAFLCLGDGARAQGNPTDKPVPIPGGQCRLYEDFRGRIYVAVTGKPEGGVYTLDSARDKLTRLTGKSVTGAAVTYSGQLFTTQDGRVWRRDLVRGKPVVDVTAKFGGVVGADGAVVVTGDERVWVRGCKRYRTADGRYIDVPGSGEGEGAVLPATRDIAGNDWTIGAVEAGGAKRRLLVSPAQLRLPATSGPIVLPPDAIPTWQAGPVNHGLTPGDWQFIAADDRGHIWAATPDSLWVQSMRPGPYRRKGEPPPPVNKWARVRDKGISGASITAMTRRPLGGTLVGYSSGRILQVESADFGSWQAGQSGPGKVKITVMCEKGAGAVRCLWVDRGGGVWAVSGESLASVGECQWQGWRRRPLFPWGFMGAGSCSYQDRLFVGGGLHGVYGLPASSHTGAQYVMAAGQGTPWARVCRLRLARGFTGATEWRGRLWLMCGTSIEWHGCGSTDWVENFDPKTGDLNIGRRVYGWRAHAAAVTWDDRLWVLGMGMKLGKYWGFMESIGPEEKKWRKEPEPPITFTRTTQGGIYDRVPVSACVIDNVFYVFTSQHGLLAYYPAMETWRVDLAEPPEKPYQGHVMPVNGEVWFVGNAGLHAFSPEQNRWRHVAALPAKRQWGFAGRMGNEIVIGGGYGASGRPEIFASQETFSLGLPAKSGGR